MSNETPSPLPDRDDRLYLVDMVEFCERVLAYSAGHDQASLLADRMRYDAVLRNLELIGEAATHVPENLRQLAPAIAWRQIVGTRNRLAHAYLGIEPDTLWFIVSGSVPTSLAQLRELLSRLPPAA
jgi:uncharacterized protein with HEPN domain